MKKELNKNSMKRLLFILIFLTTGTIFAQEKGLHLTLGGSLGKTGFNYHLDGGSSKERTGYGGYLGMQYFFSYNWGISLEGEFTVFNTQSYYPEKTFLFKGQVDDEGDVYDLKIRLKNWKEDQTTHFMEIPLMAIYQHKFGKKERHGVYLGLGVKAQIPISNSFKRTEGEVRVSGYYPQWNLPLGEEGLSVEIPQHGYGTNANRQWGGANNLKTGVALTGKFGFMIGFSPRVDLTFGIYADYGLSNIGNKKESLIGPVEGKTQQEGDYVSEFVYYNGILNSNQTNYINTMSLRAQVGFRIKIGKLKPRDTQLNDDMEKELRGKTGSRDTLFVFPIIIMPPTIKEGENRKERAERERDDEDNVLNTKNKTSDFDSIPKAVKEELIEAVYFDLGKSVLTAEAKETLNRKVALMKKYPQTTLSVIGHTCNLGSESFNDKLAYERAETVRYYLVKKGISLSRIITVSEGMKNPTHQNTSEHSRELNRRVDFLAH